MRLRNNRWLIISILIITALLLAACDGQEETAKVEPIHIEKVEGSDYNRLTLSEQAASRLDIQSEAVSEQEVEGDMAMVIPYSAVIYGNNGETWVYIRNPGPDSLTFFRGPITIERIEGGLALLSAGPPLGTEVVTVGVAELYGADTGVGK